MPEFTDTEETDETYPSREYEDSGIMDFITEYDEYTLWDELGIRLAKRDISLLLKSKGNIKRNPEEIMLEREALYGEEFEKNGLKNIEVKGIGEIE